MNIIPESHRDLVSDESKAIAYLATTLSDGAPIITPVWFGVIDEHICFFTGESSLKARNMIARPDVSVVLQDPDDIYRYVQIRGRYVKHVSEGARDWLNDVSMRYIGKTYTDDPSPDGVIVFIKPERVNVFGWSAE